MLIQKIASLYTKAYPCILINKLQINTTTPLPADFRAYTLLDVGFNSSKFRNKEGSFWSLWQTPTNNKKIYLTYEIDASILAFKAKHNMHNDKILSNSDYEEQMIRIKNLASNLITCEIPANLITKNYIKQHELLSFNKLQIKKDLLKGVQIRAYIIEGPLVLSTESVLLEDGNIGDRVRIKTEKNKFFYAKIISKSEAMIIQ
ncbi:MAG: flagellar basal body P-ring formation protein FlgA [Sulfurospirillum sp.]|nr:flagellar basal body P-ring formation protein FlgA [Sulfurospirillum sp.]